MASEAREVGDVVVDTVRRLDLRSSTYFVIGGGVLALWGIRDAIEDIDMLADSSAINELASRHSRGVRWTQANERSHYKGANKTLHLESNDLVLPVSATTHIGRPHYPMSFYTHSEYVEQVRGVPCLSLDIVAESKRALGREKDLADLELIAVHLGAVADLRQPSPVE